MSKTRTKAQKKKSLEHKSQHLRDQQNQLLGEQEKPSNVKTVVTAPTAIKENPEPVSTASLYEKILGYAPQLIYTDLLKTIVSILIIACVLIGIFIYT